MAKLAGSSKITLSEMSQEINLKRYLGRDATEKERKTFAALAVEYMNNRTLDGKEVGNSKDFTRYTEEYADLKGVTRGSVDLFSKGDMLDALDGELGKKNIVRLEVEGDLEVKKGYNHHTGDTVPPRPCFGLTRDEVRSLAEQAKSEEKETFTLSELQQALAVLGVEQES